MACLSDPSGQDARVPLATGSRDYGGPACRLNRRRRLWLMSVHTLQPVSFIKSDVVLVF